MDDAFSQETVNGELSLPNQRPINHVETPESYIHPNSINCIYCELWSSSCGFFVDTGTWELTVTPLKVAGTSIDGICLFPGRYSSSWLEQVAHSLTASSCSNSLKKT